MQKGDDTVSVRNLLTGCADLQVDCWGSGDSCYGQQVAVWARGKANGGNPFLRTRTPGSWFLLIYKGMFPAPYILPFKFLADSILPSKFMADSI